MNREYLLYCYVQYCLQLLYGCASIFIFHCRLIAGARARVFVIDSVYGRLGNNVQQILIAIAHAEIYSGSISMSNEFYAYITQIGIVPEELPHFVALGNLSTNAFVICADFFHYSNYSLRGNAKYSPWMPGLAPQRNSILSERRITKAIRAIALRCRIAFFPLVKPSKSISLILQQRASPDLLVLHLRAGDVSNLLLTEYTTNPLCYYQCLGMSFRNLIIVTEPGPDHLLLPFIIRIFDNVRIICGDYRDDFSLLSNSPVLATSGVSTFPIAACLLSNRIEQLYSSDVFLREHLNPLHLKYHISVRLFRMPGFCRLWRTSSNREELLHRYKPQLSEFTSL